MQNFKCYLVVLGCFMVGQAMAGSFNMYKENERQIVHCSGDNEEEKD